MCDTFQAPASNQASGASCPYLSVEKTLRYVTCTKCHVIFKVNQTLARHLTGIHKVSNSTARAWADRAIDDSKIGVTSQIVELRKMYEFSSSGVGEHNQTSENVLPALEGLKIFYGYSCPDCIRCYTTLNYLREHLEISHQLSGSGLDDVLLSIDKKGTCKLQTIQLGNKRSFFRVHTEDGDNELQLQLERGMPGTDISDVGSHISELTEYISLFEDEAPPQTTIEREEDLRTCNDFVSRLKIMDILRLEKIEIEVAANLAGSVGERCEIEMKLASLSELYLRQVPEMILDAAPALLDSLYPRDERSFEPVSFKTIQKYGSVLSRFLVSAYRFHKAERLEPIFHTLFDDFEESVQQEAPEEAQLRSVHKIMKLLCLVRRRTSQGVRGLFVRTFFACSTVFESEEGEIRRHRLGDAHECTHTLAAMQNFILSTALVELEYVKARNESRACNVTTADGTPSQRDYFDAWETEETEVLALVDRRGNTALSFVRTVLNIAMHILKHRTVDISFDICRKHPYCGFIDGVEISMRNIGKVVRKLQKNIEVIIESDLLLGGRYPPGFQESIERISDRLSEKRIGFSFLKGRSSNERMRCWSAWVFREMERNGQAAQKIVALPNSNGTWTTRQVEETFLLGNLRVYRTGVQKWLEACQRIQEMILVCLHLSSGSPARATELETYRIENSSKALRNVYVSQGEIFTVSRYTKMRCQLGSDNQILRLPDPRTGYLMKTYLSLFRRIEACFVGSLYDAAKMRSHREWLFVRRGERYNAERIREIIGDRMKTEGMDVGVREIRHFCAEMVRSVARFSVVNVGDVVDEYEEVGHAQAGHTRNTADHNYGRTQHDVRGLGRRVADKYRSFAREWHKCMFHWESPNHVVAERTQLVSTNEGESLQLSAIMPMLQEHFNRIYKRLDLMHGSGNDDTLQREHGDFDAFLSPSKRQKIDDGVRYGCMIIKPTPRDRNVDGRHLLPALRKFLRKENATFMSLIQADVTAEISEGRDDALVVMPTGSGKTLCVFLPVFMEGTEYCTILISPLAALADDLIRRAQSLGLKVATWRERKQPGTQLYVFAVEHVVRDEYKSLLGRLSGSGKLRRIVVDEAHISIVWDDFRPALQMMRFMIHSVTQPVQRVLLSATVPPRDRSRVLMAHGMRHAVLYSTSTARRNLSFEVLHCSSSIGKGLPSLLTALLQSMRNEAMTEIAFKCPVRILIFVMRVCDIPNVYTGVQKLLMDSPCTGMVFTYHAQMERIEKERSHDQWCKSDGVEMSIMICTSAFGIGVDTGNVRYVYHLGGSASLLQYAQESGRGGRDGKHSKCILLWNPTFAGMQESMIANRIYGCDRASERESEEMKLAAWDEFQKWATLKNVCRKSSLYSVLDGLDSGPCFYDVQSANCDVCALWTVQEQTAVKASTSGTKKIFTPRPRDDVIMRESVSVANMEELTPVKGVSSSQIRAYSPARNKTSSCKTLDRSQFSSLNSEGVGNATTGLNFNANMAEGKLLAEFMAQFHNVCRYLSGLCFKCIVLRRAEKAASQDHVCSECCKERNRCYRCQSETHSFKDCPIPPFVPSHCPKCGLNKLNGKAVHASKAVFGKNCVQPPMRNICWLLWHQDEIRFELISEMCRTDERDMLKSLIETHGKDSPITLETVLKWMHNKTGTPVHVRILCWWGSKYGIC